MSDSKTENNWSKREKGALWVKQSGRDNSEYMTGHFTDKNGNKEDVVLFRNKDRKSDRAPDWRVYESNKSASPSNKQTEFAGSTSGGDSDVL